MERDRTGEELTIRGITWAHPRGYLPLITCSEIYRQSHDKVRLVWDQRSLWSFGDEPFERYANDYDLLIIDHPFVGYAWRAGLLQPVEDWVTDAGLLRDGTFVGPSLASYRFDRRTWAIPIDAAAQVMSYRRDLIDEIPRSWPEVLDFARSTHRLLVPLSPVNALCLAFAMAANRGSRFEPDGFTDRAVAIDTLEFLRELAKTIPAACFEINPIDTLRLMATTDEWLVAGPLFGYSNYGRSGFLPSRLAFGDIPGWSSEHGPAGSTLGGAGIAVSASSEVAAEAWRFAAWLAGDEIQATEYAFAGGQPAASHAWDADLPNRITDGFFSSTRATLEGAYVRPNGPGMERFQPAAAEAVVAFLQGRGDGTSIVARIEALSRRLLAPSQH